MGDSDVRSEDSDSSLENVPGPPRGHGGMGTETTSNKRNKLRHQNSTGWEIMQGLRESLVETETMVKPPPVDGYLRKRRKWPMKGWHKRFFILEHGLLSYAKSSSHISKGRYRGQVDLGISVVCYKEKRGRIDIDADVIVHHIQNKDSRDFNRWLTGLKAHRLYRQWQLTSGGATISSIPHSGPPIIDYGPKPASPGARPILTKKRAKSTPGLEKLQKDMTNVHAKLFDLSMSLETMKSGGESNSGLNSVVDLSSTLQTPSLDSKGSTKSGGSKHRREKSYPVFSTSATDSDSKSTLANYNKSMFGSTNLLGRPVSMPQSTSNPNLVTASEHAGPGGVRPVSNGSPSRLSANHIPDAATITPTPSTNQIRPLTPTRGSGKGSSHAPNIPKISKSSIKSIHQEAFVKSAEEILDELRRITRSLHLEAEKILSTEKPYMNSPNQFSKSTLNERMACSQSRDSISEFYDAYEVLQSDFSSSDNSDDSSDESDLDVSNDDSTNKDDSLPVIEANTGRRGKLPAPQPDTSNFSLMNLLCKNIGRDLSRVRLPVILNEPLGALQKLCEDLEYSELLDLASQIEDPLERCVYVAAFAVSGYASTAFRGKTKPFNPVIGETYEYVREDKGWKYMGEQVSHHPPVSVCHCESPTWSFFQDLQLKNKFWGKSIEAIPIGTCHVVIPKFNEQYVWTKVTTCIHNIFGADRYVDHYGDMIVEGGNGVKAQITFHKANSWNAKRYEFSGTVTSKEAPSRKIQIFGKWNEGFYYGQDSTARCVWRPGVMPDDHDIYYGFTRFSIELNYLDPLIKESLPRTDTRFRPDQRMLEDSLIDEAEAEKLRIEEFQRDRMKECNDLWTPLWFKKVKQNGSSIWQFNDLYWKTRTLPNGFSKMDLPVLW